MKAARLCKACHDSGGGCCRLDPKNLTVAFPLSAHDAQRIIKATGTTRHLRHDIVGHYAYGLITAFSSGFAPFMHKSHRISMKGRASGDCHLLGPDGCLLKKSDRPLVCRAAPFWFDTDNVGVALSEHPILGADDCLLLNRHRTLEGVSKSLNLTHSVLKSMKAEYIEAKNAHADLLSDILSAIDGK